MKEGQSELIIGRSDKASFPLIGLSLVKVKVDSGAYTSAIHCCQISHSQDDKLEIIFLDEEDPNYTGTVYEFTDFKTKSVRSSNGALEDRYIISTKIELFEYLFDIDLSLTYRGDMRFPVLLGRKFLSENRFIINPRLKNSLHKQSVINKEKQKD